ARVYPVITIPRWVLRLRVACADVPRHVLAVRHADVLAVLGDHEAFSVEPYERKMAVIGTFLLGRGFTPAYRREIEALRCALWPGDLDLVRDIAAEHAQAAIDRARTLRRLDVATGLAGPVLMAVVERWFGITRGDESLFGWFNTVSSYIFVPDVLHRRDLAAKAAQAGAEIARHLHEMIRARQAMAVDGTTVLGRLLAL